MKLEELKQQIESSTLDDQLIIFVNNENTFLSNQYITEIARIKRLPIEYLENLNFLKKSSFDIFGMSAMTSNSTLRVYKTDKISELSTAVFSETNLIIVCNKFELEDATFSRYVIKLPKLEEWMIKDYVYSLLEGIQQKDLDWLVKVCDNNIERLDQEISKLSMFDPRQRQTLFRDFVDEHMLGDLSEYTIFNITNAIQAKDKQTLKTILPEIQNIDVEAVGLVKVLWQNIKKLISVWMTPNPTPENTGLKSNQIYAISKLPRVFTPQQLIDSFECVSNVDYQLKSGDLPAELIVDYLIIKILSI